MISESLDADLLTLSQLRHRELTARAAVARCLAELEAALTELGQISSTIKGVKEGILDRVNEIATPDGGAAEPLPLSVQITTAAAQHALDVTPESRPKFPQCTRVHPSMTNDGAYRCVKPMAHDGSCECKQYMSGKACVAAGLHP